MTNKLDELWQLKQEREFLISARDGKVQLAIPKEVQDEIDFIMDNYQQDIAKIDAAIAETEFEVRGLVVSEGKTLDSDHLQAQFNKGRETCDMKGLKGYAVANPEVNAFIKVGDPYVTIKEKKS